MRERKTMLQAITTKYLGATNYRGSRIKAKCQATTLTVSWDDALDVEANHEKAAQALVAKMSWENHGKWHGGALPDDTGYAFVCVKTEAR
jgi:hypothetical protein